FPVERVLELLHPEKLLHHAVSANTDRFDFVTPRQVGEEMPITYAITGGKRIPEHHDVAFGQGMPAAPAVLISSNVKHINHEMVGIQVRPGPPAEDGIELDQLFA